MKQFDIAMYARDFQIVDSDADGAPGTSAYDLAGDIVTIFEYRPDNPRCETYLVYADGKVIQISCDPPDVREPGAPWQVCYYNCTELPVADRLRALEHGHWL